MTLPLGLETDLDADAIHITNHALERYNERRSGTRPDWDFVEAKLRSMLAKAAGQRPPVYCANGSPVRRYTAGGFTMVVSADHGALITVYPLNPKVKPSHGGGRKARHGARPSRDWTLDDELAMAQ